MSDRDETPKPEKEARPEDEERLREDAETEIEGGEPLENPQKDAPWEKREKNARQKQKRKVSPWRKKWMKWQKRWQS